MTTLASIAVAFVALLHVGFLVLEMFLWKKPYGGRRFGLSRDDHCGHLRCSDRRPANSVHPSAASCCGVGVGAGGVG